MADAHGDEYDSDHHRSRIINSKYSLIHMVQSEAETKVARDPFVELKMPDCVKDLDDEQRGLSSYGTTLTIFKPIQGHIERESNSTRMLIGISLASVLLDLARQLSSYSLKYYNKDVYPVPSTLLVFLAELLKLLIFVVQLLRDGQLTEVKISFSYFMPSLLYAMNNNIYFIALLYTTPPVWNVLMQVRVIMTACVYRFFFKKLVTKIQWLALVILTLSIGILQFSGSNDGDSGSNDDDNVAIALLLAGVASVCATIGPIYAEYLLKNDQRTFDDKQFQMYLFGSIITCIMAMIQRPVTSDSLAPLLTMKGNPIVIESLIIAVVILTAFCGIIVAVIMKKLDNIVKLYTQAMSSGLTCLACIILFPRVFQFDILFVASLLMTSFAIYLYEMKTITCNKCCATES